MSGGGTVVRICADEARIHNTVTYYASPIRHEGKNERMISACSQAAGLSKTNSSKGGNIFLRRVSRVNEKGEGGIKGRRENPAPAKK